MALELNTNSYVTVDNADSYFETRIDSAAWFDASDEVKEQALVTATQLVDDNAWIGSAVSPSQALAWPRKYAIYYDQRLGQEISFSVTEIPERLKTAIYEQALHLVNNEDLYGAEKEEQLKKLNEDMWGDEATAVEDMPKPYTKYKERLEIYSKDMSEMDPETRSEKIKEIRNSFTQSK